MENKTKFEKKKSSRRNNDQNEIAVNSMSSVERRKNQQRQIQAEKILFENNASANDTANNETHFTTILNIIWIYNLDVVYMNVA